MTRRDRHRMLTKTVPALLTALALASVAGAQERAGAALAAGARTGAVAGRTDRAVTDSADVTAAVRRYHDALERGDSAAAVALLAPDAVILESGGLETVAEYRAHHLASDIEFAKAVPETRSAIQVAVRGDVAWAASTTTSKGTFRGRAVDSSGAELMVLTRTADGWRIAAIHWSSRRRN